VEALPHPSVRLVANLQNSGRDGGHDLNYRTLRTQGIQLVGRFIGADDRRIRFADDLGASVAFGDTQYREFRGAVHRHAADHGLPAPDLPDPPPFDPAAPTELPVDRFRSVIWAGGYRPAYRDWLPWPDAFDADGFPIHRNGQSTAVPGLHFVGVHFLRKRKSSLFLGVGEDAAIIAEEIATA
jgi:putative flavoprotein involved in K+ transport